MRGPDTPANQTVTTAQPSGIRNPAAEGSSPAARIVDESTNTSRTVNDFPGKNVPVQQL